MSRVAISIEDLDLDRINADVVTTYVRRRMRGDQAVIRKGPFGRIEVRFRKYPDFTVRNMTEMLKYVKSRSIRKELIKKFL